MTTFYFVDPIGSIFVRGNLAFGGGGEHGAGVMPPPPSLFAGAFRSALLGRNAEALEQFSSKGSCDDPEIAACLGAADRPGKFRISWLTLAGLIPDSPDAVPESVFALPADMAMLEGGFGRLTPSQTRSLVVDSWDLPYAAVLRTSKQAKPQRGFYLRQTGWRKHLSGLMPAEGSDTVRASHLYRRDPRLGIGLNTDSRTVQPGLIYTTEGFAFSPTDDAVCAEGDRAPFSRTGFLVGIEGAAELLPRTGFLRLGGDGRSAHYRRVEYSRPNTSLDPVVKDGRFRLILTTPGLFSVRGGVRPTFRWLPSAIAPEGKNYVLRAETFSARLVCAAVPRAEVVSGWDLFHWKPKPAQRAVPAGAVYWFEDFRGDPGKLAEWVAGGLWTDNEDVQRRAEGFNNATLAAWPQDS
jgi:CRISPR-associated protein Cmr3